VICLYRTYRQVDSTDGKNLAELNDCAWIETSAKNNLNIDRVFELCLQEIEKLYGPSQSDQPSKFGSCLIM